MTRYLLSITTLFFMLFMQPGCNRGVTDQNGTPDGFSLSPEDEALLDTIQHLTFRYFWDGAEPVSGMARERFHMNGIYPQNDKHIVTSGGSGFGIMAMIVGIERGFITREQGLERFEQIMSFLERADRFHGVCPHWWDGETGKVKPFSMKDNGGDLVETSFLVQGLMALRKYLDDGNGREHQLIERISQFIDSVEWNWHERDGVLLWHWSRQYEWEMNHAIHGYNECLITYVLAATGDHAISPETYHTGWARNGAITGKNEAYGYVLPLRHNGSEQFGGPLFWAHYSFLGLDPRGLSDAYADYWQNNVSQVMINYAYCVENPNEYDGYGEDCWGLTASYSISEQYFNDTKNAFASASDAPTGYRAHHPGNDPGVISPTAALASFPYAPEEAMKAARFFFNELEDRVMGPYGPYDAFSMEYNWYPQQYLAIDQGPIVVMIENFRSELLWDLFMENEEVTDGLDALGFKYRNQE